MYRSTLRRDLLSIDQEPGLALGDESISTFQDSDDQFAEDRYRRLTLGTSADWRPYKKS